MSDKITKKQQRDVQRTSWLATILGYNELAKTAPTLGEKIYYRLALGRARDRYIKLGGKLEMTKDEGDFVLVLDSETRPHINFKATDIELMRQAVAEYDAKKLSPC